jgi:hypothetical protein
VVAVDVRSGGVARVTPANGASWSLVAAADGWVLACESTPAQPFALYAAHLPPAEADSPAAQAWGWSALPLPPADRQGYPAAVREALGGLTASVLQVAPPLPPLEVGFEAVVLHRWGPWVGRARPRAGLGAERKLQADALRMARLPAARSARPSRSLPANSGSRIVRRAAALLPTPPACARRAAPPAPAPAPPSSPPTAAPTAPTCPSTSCPSPTSCPWVSVQPAGSQQSAATGAEQAPPLSTRHLPPG